jgi:sugar phosphate isomerase/epimerase
VTQAVTRAIGIDFISFMGLPPVHSVALAAELGCQHISIALAPMPGNPPGNPLWSLREDAVLRRDLIAAQRDYDITISLGEGFLIRPGTDIRDTAADLEIMRELGIPIANIVAIDPDWNRSIDQLAAFAELAAASGLRTTLEMMPGMLIGNLEKAVAAIKETGKPNLRLLLDSMHVFRSGATAADIEKLDPALIGYVQLCDVPLVSKYESYGEEARFERLIPGEGELPLADFIKALPAHLMLGLEIPMRAKAQAGVTLREALAPAVTAIRALLAA